MATSVVVKQIQEIFAGSVGTGFTTNNVRNYVRKLRVILDSDFTENRFASPGDVQVYPGLPRPYGSYISQLSAKEQDLNALCVRLTAEREHPDDWQTWIVTADYSTEIPDHGPITDGTYVFGDSEIGPQNQPWLLPPKIEWDVQETTVARQYDLNGHAFLNSARVPFSPAPAFEEAYPVLIISRNEQNFTASHIADWSFVVNSAPFLGRLAGQVQCLPPKAKKVYFGRTPYYQAVYRLRFKVTDEMVPLALGKLPATWQPDILDQGYHRLVEDQALGKFVPRPIYEGMTPVSRPRLLDGAGEVLVLPNADLSNDPVYIRFDVYRQRNFSELFNGITP